MALLSDLRRPSPVSARSHLRELVLLGSLYVAYSLTRLLGGQELPRAQGRAEHLLRVERAVHLDVEMRLNQAVSGVAWLAVPMDYWYAVLHYVVTPAALAWLYCRNRGSYARARNAIVVASALGLLGYFFFPTAPPRLMEGLYTDTLATYAHFGWWSDNASAPAGLGGLTNELAAMPSLHVGWAVWVTWALYRHVSPVGRVLLVAYPTITTLVVVSTANHWLLDCVLGGAVTLVGVLASHLVGRSQGQEAVRPGRRPRVSRLPSTARSPRPGGRPGSGRP
jgi:hypothetical protein